MPAFNMSTDSPWAIATRPRFYDEGMPGNRIVKDNSGGEFSVPIDGGSTNIQDELMSTVSPATSAEGINQAADRVNQVYDTRREALRRKYSDFPDMASAEENAMERARANELAKVQTEGNAALLASRRSVLGQIQNQNNIDRNRFDRMNSGTGVTIGGGNNLKRSGDAVGGGVDQDLGNNGKRGNFINMSGERTAAPGAGELSSRFYGGGSRANMVAGREAESSSPNSAFNQWATAWDELNTRRNQVYDDRANNYGNDTSTPIETTGDWLKRIGRSSSTAGNGAIPMTPLPATASSARRVSTRPNFIPMGGSPGGRYISMT